MHAKAGLTSFIEGQDVFTGKTVISVPKLRPVEELFYLNSIKMSLRNRQLKRLEEMTPVGKLYTIIKDRGEKIITKPVQQWLMDPKITQWLKQSQKKLQKRKVKKDEIDAWFDLMCIRIIQLLLIRCDLFPTFEDYGKFPRKWFTKASPKLRFKNGRWNIKEMDDYWWGSIREK